MRYINATVALTLTLILAGQGAVAQEVTSKNWITSPGIIGTIVLIALVLAVGVIILLARISGYLRTVKKQEETKSRLAFKKELLEMEGEEIDELLEKRRTALEFRMKGTELGGEGIASDDRGLIQQVESEPDNPLFDEKKKSGPSLQIPNELSRLIVWYLGAAVFWLVFGTAIGQYLGMKFVWPELDGISWLSFGRLRPVHTNTVFWGWGSLAMIGLGHFVITRTSNIVLNSYRSSWIAFALINLAVLLGNLCLMSGINNGGGEYREYIWPVMLLFAIGLILTFRNFYRTVASRKISEIYISNWFILAALGWTIVLCIIGYLPMFQNGLGETVIQGYYMHQGVGMWFMTFTLGLTYYYLPSTLNKPIYSYSLGVLAFWTQMLFYTLIGTHHFVFSPLPWWLQTVALVFRAGMFIPVIAGSTNFLMTMRGSWNHISKSYVLPFFLVGVVFYFVGSAQGSFQAFRFTNYVWHFTDFNVAHSHMTMYGIITFILWACIYTIVPKLRGTEPPQILVGAHFWMAFIGLFAYMISMMAGGTLKGLSWLDGHPFIQSVILMKEYWIWRAVGGSLMFLSHLVFAYNFYLMVRRSPETPSVPQPITAKA